MKSMLLFFSTLFVFTSVCAAAPGPAPQNDGWGPCWQQNYQGNGRGMGMGRKGMGGRALSCQDRARWHSLVTAPEFDAPKAQAFIKNANMPNSPFVLEQAKKRNVWFNNLSAQDKDAVNRVFILNNGNCSATTGK